ncbi:MAG: amidohydrolase family protein [Candidatus Cloacimonadaceae bacterium]|nr:amidohydrolase family protein [Candidatus Cloacimonadota bacterium]
MKLIHGGHFYINSSFENDIKAIMIENGKISALLKEMPSNLSDYEQIDLKGGWAYPGFIDTHTHSFEGGLYSLGVDLSSARSISDVLDLIKAADKSHGKHLFAWNFDELKLKEQRFPTRAELDRALPDKNLILRRMDGHACIVNSHACHSLANAGKRPKCDNEVFKSVENDQTVHWFHNTLDDETILSSYQAAAAIALKGGFCTIHTMVGDANESIGHYRLLQKHLKDYPVDYILYPQSFNIEAALEVGANRVGGCILADGSIGSYTAAMYESYQGLPIRGTLYQSDQFWRSFISRAHRYNLQVAVHCIGDKAITQINNVYLGLANSDFKDLRHQLIHCEVTDDVLINHIKASAAVPVMQPAFDRLWGGDNGFYSHALGLERSRSMNRFGSMVKKGIRITGSSDWYVTPLDINMSLDALICHNNPEEALSPTQAIKIYTENAAWLSHDEQIRGRIQAGLDADFSILNYNLETAPDVSERKVLAIIKRGELAYAPN